MKSLAPALLLSMPQLADPNFSRTVVLLCSHDARRGAFGLVVNRHFLTSGRVVLNADPPASTDRELEIWIGGPVEPQRPHVLVGEGPGRPDLGEHSEVAEGVYLSSSSALIGRLFGGDPPQRTRLVVGYSGWGPGQLEAEIEESAWLLSDVDRDLIFDTPPDDMWETAIRRLGADPAALQPSRGVH